MSLSRTETDIIGSQASPSTITSGSTANGSVDLTTTAGTFDAAIAAMIIVGSAPSAGPSVAFFFSLDGTNYLQDGGAITVPTTASTSTPVGPYVPPAAAKKAKLVITNNDTGSVSITAWASATTLASSNL